MPKPFFAFLLLMSSALYGQTDSTQNSEQKGWAVTLTAALVPVGDKAVGIQPGAEYRFNDRFSLLSEITVPAFGRNSKDSLTLDRKYIRLKSELRYHFFNKKANRPFHEYAGLQIAHAIRKFTSVTSYYHEDPPTDSVIFYDKARLNTPVTTLSVQFGGVISAGRFAVNVFTGFGARFVNTRLSDIINPRKGKRFHGGGFDFKAAENYKGNVTQFHFNAGIRFMWHFYDFKHPRKR